MGRRPGPTALTERYSVVVPAYNAENTIEACLTSVLAQTLAPLEVLVVDDHSNDGTAEVIRRFEGQFAAAGIALEFRRLNSNAGPSAARNRGIREAKGSYIAFLDADDTWMSEKLAIVDRFAEGSSAALICHAYTERSSWRSMGGADRYAAKRLAIYDMLLRNPAQTSCAVMRKQPGLVFDETMRHCEDYDLWMRIAEDSSVLRLVGDPLTCLGRPQLTSGGLSGNTMQMRAGEMRVYLNFCRRTWRYRAWLLPFLLSFSLLKHAYSRLRRR